MILLGQPEIARKDTRFTQAFLRAQVNSVLAEGHSRVIHRTRRGIRQALPFGLSPELIHRIELRSSAWQKTQLNVQSCGQDSTRLCRMGRATIFKQNNLPTPPMAADHLEESLVCILIPNFGNQQGHLAGANIDRTVNHSSGMTAANRNTLLFTIRA